jgi:hypothetical protein
MRNALVLLSVGAAVAAAPAATPASTPDWSDPAEVAPGSGSSVGIDAEGAVTVAWQQYEPYRAFVAERPPRSDRFGAPEEVGSGATAPQLAVNDAGAAVIGWIEQLAPCQLSFYCAHRLGLRTRAAGARGFGAVAYLGEDALEAPKVAMNERGQAVVAWATKGGAVVAAGGSAGTGFGTPVVLRPAGGQGFAPRVTAAIGEGGAALVGWGTFGGPPMASYRPAGGRFGAPEAVVPAESNGTISAVVDGRGRATAAVLTNERARARLRVATRGPDGGFREIGGFAAERVGGVALDLDPSGDQLIHWTQQTSPEENSRLVNQAYASFGDSAGSWGPPIAVSRPNSEPLLRLDRHGNAHALWSTGGREGQRVMGATLTRFGLLERPQELTHLIGQVGDMEVNRSGAAVGVFTEYVATGGPVPDARVRVVSRPADERPAAVRVAVSFGATAARVRARCDEPCRLRARIRSGSAAARASGVLTLRAGRRGSLRVPLTSRARARLQAGRRVALVVRAADGAGNVRRIVRRVGR